MQRYYLRTAASRRCKMQNCWLLWNIYYRYRSTSATGTGYHTLMYMMYLVYLVVVYCTYWYTTYCICINTQ